MELTPMRVKYKGADLGGTLGNVAVHIEYVKAEIKADQSGETVRDRRTSGLNISVVTELTQIKDKNVWKTVFPHASLVTDPVTSKQQIYFMNNIGDSDLAQAGDLVLHPLSLSDTDLSGDYKFFLACADAKSEIVYGPKDQAKLKVTWNIMPDDSVSPERFLIHGDSSIGLVHAAAGAPSFVGTGNGTLGSIIVHDGKTKNENITAKCIQATGTPIFEVVGSVSGPLGNAYQGTAFTSPVIDFLISAGLTAFVLNDEFTVATTASNFV
jgi:hypothetical protein